MVPEGDVVGFQPDTAEVPVIDFRADHAARRDRQPEALDQRRLKRQEIAEFQFALRHDATRLEEARC